jgi:SUR7/PalI family
MPEDHVYFLQSTTAGIPMAPNPARWTYWSICGVDGKLNANCGDSVPALPFAPANKHNFDTATGVPMDFTGHYYYYMSRFSWVFFLMALLFSVFALLTGALALCTRFGAYLSGLNTLIAFFWQALASALMTYVFLDQNFADYQVHGLSKREMFGTRMDKKHI